MATIKAYTTIEQSRKLAEFLPFESADTLHCIDFDGDLLFTVPKQYSGSFRHQPELIIPCWSLAALLEIIRNNGRYELEMWEGGYSFESGDIITEPVFDAIDACVDMIEKLHELKML